MIVKDSRVISQPRSTTFGKNGVLAILDHPNRSHSNSSSCVSIFDSQGKVAKRIRSMGNKNGQFCYPQGIAFDASSNLFVAEYTR